VLRRIAIFALLAFLAIVLAGPLLAILAVMVSFALVAFLLWVPLFALFAGNRDRCKHCLRHAQAFCQETVRVGREAILELVRLGQDVGTTARATLAIIAAVLVETLSGALVGGFFVYLSEGEHALPPVGVVAGALVGGVVGLLIVLSNWRTTRAFALQNTADTSR
jgi:hypothetical protein